MVKFCGKIVIIWCLGGVEWIKVVDVMLCIFLFVIFFDLLLIVIIFW